MADPAALLQQLHLAGFEFHTFEQFPRAMGVVRGECVALLLPGGTELQVLGSPGWLIDGAIGVLTTAKGKRVFQSKSQLIEATDERIALLTRFEADLRAVLSSEPH